jgi:protein-disulfide isomerase
VCEIVGANSDSHEAERIPKSNMKRMCGILVSLIPAAICAAPAANAQSKSAPPAAVAEAVEPARAAIEQIVREYILRHPEVLMESARQYQDRLQAAQKERSRDAVAARLTELQKDPSSPSAGVTVVEFFDYRCGFCKKAESTIVKMMANHPDIQFVFKEFPILGPDSLLAAKAGLAAHKQGGYLKFHQALMSLPGPITLEAIQRLAGKQGLDVERLKIDMESPEIQAVLERNRQLAQQAGIGGTPSFVIGSELVPGAIDEAAFEGLIAKAKLPNIQLPNIQQAGISTPK